MRYNELGQELPDPTPLEVPLGVKRPASLQEQIQAMIRSAVSSAAERNGHETFEEANDFEIDDDDFTDQMTEHEFRTMKVEIPEGAKATLEEFRAKRRESLSSSGKVGGDAGKKGKASSGEVEGAEASGS